MSRRRIPPNSLLPFVRVPRVIKEIWWYGESCEWGICSSSPTCWCGLSPSTLSVKTDLWIWRDCRIKHKRSVKQWDSLRSLLLFNRLRWVSSVMSCMTWWWWPTPNCSTTKNNSWWSFPRAYPTSLRWSSNLFNLNWLILLKFPFLLPCPGLLPFFSFFGSLIWLRLRVWVRIGIRRCATGSTLWRGYSYSGGGTGWRVRAKGYSRCH